MSSGEDVSDELYVAMWRVDEGWRDGARCRFYWVVTPDREEFSNTIIDWAFQDQLDNYEPREFDVWRVDRPRRPSSLRHALRWLHHVREYCGGEFVWFKASHDRHIELWTERCE